MSSLSFFPFPQLFNQRWQFLHNGQCFLLVCDKHLLNTYNVLGSMGNAGNGYKIPLMQLLLYARHLPCMNSFNSHKDPMEYVSPHFIEKEMPA